MIRKQATKTALAHNAITKEWDNSIVTAAENGFFTTNIAIARNEEELQLFTTWLQFNNFTFVDATLPQHHNYIYEVSWR